MPLFFFDTNHGANYASDLVGTILADRSAAKIKAMSCIAEMTTDLPDGHHELTVLVRSDEGSPVVRVALTLTSTRWTKVKPQRQNSLRNDVVIVSSTAIMLN